MTLVATGSRIVAWRLVQKVANAFVVVLIAGRLGPAGQGYYSLTLMVAMVTAAILGGGVGLAAVPPLRQGRFAPRRVLAAQSAWLGVLAAVLALAVVLGRRGAAWPWLQAHLGWQPAALVATALVIIALVSFDIHAYDLLAAGRVVVGTVIGALRASAQVIAIGALVLAGALGLQGAIAVLAAVQIAAAIAMAVLAARALPSSPAPAQERPSLTRLVGWCLRHGWLGQLSAVAYLLLLRVDQGILELDHGAATVGIYSIAVWAAELLWMLPEAMNPLLVHASAATDDPRARDATAARAVRLGLAATAIAAVIVALVARPVLEVVLGGQYAASVAPLRALLPGIVGFAPGAVLAGDFIGRGRPAWNTQASGVTVSLNVALCLWWIPAHGAIGAAWASTCAYTVGSFIMLLRFRRVTGLSWATVLLARPSDLHR